MLDGETYCYLEAAGELKRVNVFGRGPVPLSNELEAAIRADMTHHAGKERSHE